MWDIVKAPLVTRTADRVLSPLIGKSLVVYLTKPDATVVGRPARRPAERAPWRARPARARRRPTQGAAA